MLSNTAKVVCAGGVSVRIPFWASLGPLLVAAGVYVMVWPAFTGSGVSVLVTTRSAEVSTSVVAVPVLLAAFGSTTPEPAGIDAVAELLSVVLLATSLLTVTTI